MTMEYRRKGWDPIYKNDESKEYDENLIDSLTLGLAGARQNSARQAAAEEIYNLGLPEYSEQGYEYGGDFTPTLYDRPEEAQATLATDSAEGRAAQLAALAQMGELTDQSVGSQQQLDRLRAQTDAAQFAQGREGLIRQDAARRGQIGGAADMIARAQAAQMAADRNQAGGLQSAQQAALQRLAGTQAQGALGGQIRGQDNALAMYNTDAINAFNRGNVAARNATSAANVDLRNNAARGNRDARQDISNRNVDRGDMITGATYGAAANRAGALANTMQGIATGMQNQGAQQQAAASKAADWISKFFGAGAS